MSRCHGVALVDRTGGRSTGGGRSQEASDQWIFFAHGLIGHHGDLTVAGRGDERDDAAPLEKAEDAFARAFDDGLDVLLGRCRRRVEHETLPVAVRRVQSVEENWNVAHLFLIDAVHPRVFRHLYGFGPRWFPAMARIVRDRMRNWAEIRAAEAYLSRGEKVPPNLRSNYIIACYEFALLQYFPPSLDVDTTLFQASGNRSDVPNNGYKSSEIPRLRRIHVQGDHVRIVRDDVAFKPIAEVLCAELRRLREGFVQSPSD